MTLLSRLLTLPQEEQQNILNDVNSHFAQLSAVERVSFVLNTLPGKPVLSSSFGAQAAVMLHLVTQQCPNIPVIFLDTGYLFAQTYQFADELTARFNLNLKVYRSELSPAWQEARWGHLWKTAKGLKHYNHLNKIEPMNRALQELAAGAWFSGIRRIQSTTRQSIPFAEINQNILKLNPLADWQDRHIHDYLKKFSLPYHPLWDLGYVSIGDTHSTRPLTAGLTPEETRFNGLGRECGLHTNEVWTGGGC
ncbi:MAG: phosphoadenylyl-sulfate reductase [Pseudomonadota bacterium]